MATHFPDGFRLRNSMQLEKVSSTLLLKRAGEFISSGRLGTTCTGFSATQLSEMLSERRKFNEDLFRLVAAVLKRDDPLHFTRRNGCVYHLGNENEHNARIEIGRLIHLQAISPTTQCLYQFLLDGIARRSLPGKLADFEVSPKGWVRILESLSPAGLIDIRANKYRIATPSTEELISRSKNRLEQLLICNRLLFDPEVGGFARRKVVANQIQPTLKRMQQAKNPNEYLDADIDVQLELGGGDYDQYQHMLISARSYRHTLELLYVHREHDSSLQYQEGFVMPFEDWHQRLTDHNSNLVKRLKKLLQDEESMVEDTEKVLRAMVEATMIQIRALDNAKEVQRGTRKEFRRYDNLAWPKFDFTLDKSAT